MRIPFSFIKTSGPPPFDPATLNPDGWWRTNYDNFGINHAWLPTASGGGSGSNGNLSTQGGLTTPPTLGSNINGAGTAGAVSDGTKIIPTDNGFATFLEAAGNAGTVVIFFRGTSQGVAGVNGTADAGMIFDVGNSNICMASSSSGVRVCANGFQNTPFISLAVNVYAMAAARWTGGTSVNCRVSQPSGTTDATHTMLSSFGLTGNCVFGGQHTGSNGLVGDWEEAIVWKRILLDSELVNLVSYFNHRYGKGLT